MRKKLIIFLKLRITESTQGGATMDIGFGAISGAFERGHDFTYVCVDNEAYMKTGVQSSSGTHYDASTTTTPAGKFPFGNPFPKKNMPTIMASLTSLHMWLQTL